MEEKYTVSTLQAISDWQRGGDPKQNKRRGKTLKEQSASLPYDYRTCELCCFRQIALPKGGVWDLIGEDKLSEKVSSWTTNIEIAKRFKGGVPPDGQGYQGVIICVYPQPGDVIVNLDKLYRDTAFTQALEKNKEVISSFHKGAGCYGGEQNEVVLEILSVSQQDIYSMGGHSSSFEDLVHIAAMEIYGRSVTLQEREELMLKVGHLSSEAGASWLSQEATRRVVEKMKPHVERLTEIKRQQ